MNELNVFDELENRIRHFTDEFHRLKAHTAEVASESYPHEKIQEVEQKIQNLIHLIDQLETELSND
ncbi:MAG: hypothetical protein GXO90_07175 [FCB group bacterium]|nr:hypothetical protein [FCB group bacterium]